MLPKQDEREVKGEMKALLATAIQREREALRKLEEASAELAALKQRLAKAESSTQVEQPRLIWQCVMR